MKAGLRLLLILSVIDTVFGSGTRVGLCWGPFAHSFSAPNDPDTGMSLSPEMNLPDYWGTSYYIDWAPTWPIQAWGEVKPLFAWTHDCQRRGGNTGYFNLSPFCFTAAMTWIPVRPYSYGQPAGVSIAERDMYNLLCKMRGPNEVLWPRELMTVRGWAGHNALDAVAHFDLFPGTLPSSTDWTPWCRHAVYERYADYWLLMVMVPEAGIALSNPGGSFTWETNGVHGDARLILLGQKCFRKNRHTVDAALAHSQQYEPLNVDPWTETDVMIVRYGLEVSPMRFTIANSAGWTEFS